ncbi:xaa-Pro aminopeptidase 3-like [Schistocerca gregaria]|uniref:xaa-Pro aminopeptidase 3-like n=1 Tax=Schistocerca gregaria TaxID=7010 RepID=UPI00211DBF13|nr:xaa-Pro aminopeptidase 3-like [Schistocerca gregaria]
MLKFFKKRNDKIEYVCLLLPLQNSQKATCIGHPVKFTPVKKNATRFGHPHQSTSNFGELGCSGLGWEVADLFFSTPEKRSPWIVRKKNVPSSLIRIGNPQKFCTRRSSLSINYGQPHPATHPHLLKSDEVIPFTSKNEYVERRHTFLKQMPLGSVAIFPSALHCIMSSDIHYAYRQNSDFAYLCGFAEPESVMVLEKKWSGEKISALFVKPRIPELELWEGACTGVERVCSNFGFDAAYSKSQLADILPSILSAADFIAYNNIPNAFQKVFQSMLEPLRDRVINPQSIVQRMRLIKSPSELRLIERSCENSARAFVQVMRTSKPLISEQELDALIEFECRRRGCQRLAYCPVVASGLSCNTLHYIDNNRIVQDGDLILMDAGGEYFNYASDITRTWPANGRFSPAQRQVYAAVLNVYKKCLEVAKPTAVLNGRSTTMSLFELQKYAIECTKHELNALGIPQNGDLAVERFYPHMIGHYLGMDIHDVSLIGYNEPFAPGMVITIEPGLYIPDDPDVPDRYRGIGVRIEDDILITDNQPKVLTDLAPKETDQIENLLRR